HHRGFRPLVDAGADAAARRHLPGQRLRVGRAAHRRAHARSPRGANPLRAGAGPASQIAAGPRRVLAQAAWAWTCGAVSSNSARIASRAAWASAVRLQGWPSGAVVGKGGKKITSTATPVVPSTRHILATKVSSPTKAA